LAGLGFIVVMCSVNMLPNMSLPNLQFYFAAGLGALMNTLPKQAALEAARAAAEQSGLQPSAAGPDLRHVGLRGAVPESFDDSGTGVEVIAAVDEYVIRNRAWRGRYTATGTGRVLAMARADSGPACSPEIPPNFATLDARQHLCDVWLTCRCVELI
jgi:hypothetical protein